MKPGQILEVICDSSVECPMIDITVDILKSIQKWGEKNGIGFCRL